MELEEILTTLKFINFLGRGRCCSGEEWTKTTATGTEKYNITNLIPRLCFTMCGYNSIELPGRRKENPGK